MAQVYFYLFKIMTPEVNVISVQGIVMEKHVVTWQSHSLFGIRLIRRQNSTDLH